MTPIFGGVLFPASQADPDGEVAGDGGKPVLERWRAFWRQAPGVTTQAQREALVDLLLLGMHTDRVLSRAELSWESGQALSIYSHFD